jgi:hypothetical protein
MGVAGIVDHWLPFIYSLTSQQKFRQTV